MNPNLTQDMSVLSLVTGASVLVQIVLLLLLLASFFSWYYIFLKVFALKRAARLADAFEREFWGGADLNELFQRAVNSRDSAGSLERIFEAGFREFTKLHRQPGMDISAVMDGTRRAMRATYQRELDQLESHLSFLASVGSVSPYVGLFGTVWGIMNAFRGLANVAQATLGPRRAGHRRSADRDGDGPVRGDSGRGRLQPLRRGRQPAGHPFRLVHGRIFQYPAAPGALRGRHSCRSKNAAAGSS